RGKGAMQDRAPPFGGRRDPPPRAGRIERGAARPPVAMRDQARELVIVQPGAPELAVFEPESERLDQMQLGARVRREADHGAGVGWDLGVDENDRDHLKLLRSPAALLHPRSALAVPQCTISRLAAGRLAAGLLATLSRSHCQDSR